MAKNIGLFIDGTWNSPAGAASTNVRKLYEDARDNGGPEQVSHYMSGVGTEAGGFEYIEPFRKRSGIRSGLQRVPRRVRNWLGGAFGWGTSFKIKEAYAFLCDNYQQGDRVYLFGFSRGAFAARSLAGFVEEVGVLYRDQIELVEEAYALYESPSDEGRRRLASAVRAMAGRSGPFAEGEFALPIYLIGVWDTVGALGIPRRRLDMPAYFTEFHKTELPSNVSHARHALAAHELRKKFEPLLWNGCRRWQSLKQVWFPGAHADVGGGYPETYLSDGALRWMAEEAQQCALKLSRWPQITGSPLGPDRVHHQLRGLFIANRATARRDLATHSSLPPTVFKTFYVHRSMCDRLRDASSARYSYLRPGVNAKLLQADRESLRMLVALLLDRGTGVVCD